MGDPVAIVAGENEKAVDKALRLIKVKYQVLEPVLDFRKALDNEVLVHPEENWKSYGNTGDVKRNLLHHEEDLQPKRMSDNRFTKARNGSDGSLRCDEGRTYPGYRPLYLIQYRCLRRTWNYDRRTFRT